MPDFHLNIIAFTIPFPANYGGVIDVFHKLVALKAQGIRIHLHCFQYDRLPAAELEPYCETISYYKRKTGLKEQFSLKPYIVNGRRSDALLKNLLSNKYPVLFEGLHSCYYLNHPELQGRKLVYRESNIEHDYYCHLARSENNFFTRVFFLLESVRLRIFQRVLKYAAVMLVVSEKDCIYLQNQFPGKEVIYLPSFHGNSEIKSLHGKGKYAFYHGNLSVAENSQAAEFLIKEVFPGLNIPLIIAGLNPPHSLLQLAEDLEITIISNPANNQMDQLLREAHVNILVTFQATGLKLKLLNTLFNGRFVLVNKNMLAGTGLDELCVIADDARSIKESLASLFQQELKEEEMKKRAELLGKRYSDEANARKLIQFIYHED